VVELALERGEARLGEDGVGGEVYWAAAVGVEDQARLRVPDRDRVRQGVRDDLGAQVVRERVADDAAGGDVDDGGQVEPAFSGRDVADVAAPAARPTRMGP
jgi:hypothetical protein